MRLLLERQVIVDCGTPTVAVMTLAFVGVRLASDVEDIEAGLDLAATSNHSFALWYRGRTFI